MCYTDMVYSARQDPLEKVNVVNDPTYAAVSKEMYNKMVEFFKSQERAQ